MRTALKYAAATSAATLAWMVIELLAGWHRPESEVGRVSGLLGGVILLTGIYLGIKEYRDRTKGGIISFRQAVLMGLHISLYAYLLGILVWLIYYRVIQPDHIAQMIEHTRAQLAAQGTSQAGIENALQEMESTFSFKMQLVIAFAGVALVGGAGSVLAALMLRKNSRPESR